MQQLAISPGNGGKRANMERYQSLANAAVVYYLLGRNDESQAALEKSQSIAQGDESMELLSGQLQLARGDAGDAEQSFRRALAMRESDAGWYWLGILYANQHRYPEAIDAMRHASKLDAPHNYEMEWNLARLQVLAGDEQAALRTLNEARQAIPYPGPAGAEARAQLSDTRAAAYSQLFQWGAAIAAEQEALHEVPDSPRRWQTLSALYTAAGQAAEATNARQQAQALSDQPQ
jgi:Flp pilus assembly protein TadD